MDRFVEHRGTRFVWNEAKAELNLRDHAVAFEEAITVFDDPLFTLRDASRNEQRRDAVIGFSARGRLLTVVHIEYDGAQIRIISAWRATASEEALYAQ